MMLSKTVILFFISVLSFLNASAFDTLKVTAELDTALKQISGVVEYNLPETIELSTFEFQLFPNIYSSADTPYLNDKPGLRERLINSKKWGSIAIDSILVNNKNVDGEFTIDYTKGILPLNKEWYEGPLEIRLYFKTIIPESGNKLSYFGNNYLLNGWFPFPAILQKNNKWYHPYYAENSELFSDYFFYDVKFTAPSDLTIIGPGSSLAEAKSINENTEHFFEFGPALDFALAIDPDYLNSVSSVGADTIRIYYRDYEFSMKDKIRNAAEKSMAHMAENVGDYEYGSLNIVFSDIGFSGGIEFPAIISLSSPRGAPALSNAYDMLTIHEVVHQWFYGMVGSNQVEYPWLDEAITNFFTLKILERYWGNTGNLFDLAGSKADMRDMNRLNANLFIGDASINQPSYSFNRADIYFSTVYDRGALAVETIDNLLGDSLSNMFWKKYFEKFKFGHPKTDDFRETLAEVAEEDLISVYDVSIESSAIIDYSVSNLLNRRIDSTDTEISFVLRRKGGIDYPIDYRIYLSNGDSLDFQAHLQYDTEEIRQTSSFPAVSILIDPNNKWTIDANLLNNSTVINPDNRPGFRLSAGIMFLIESLLSFVGGI